MEHTGYLADVAVPSRPHEDAPNEPDIMGPPPTVVTLVHGTFASGAPWTQDGSILRQQIAAELGEHGREVRYDVFEWSGRNTHSARVKAGYELAEHIRELRQRYPLCRHFIVAHSHGGNVALLAHKHLPVALHALGVATLGTPFMHARLDEAIAGHSLDELMEKAPRHVEGVSSFFSWFVGVPSAIYYDRALSGTAYNDWYWFAGAALATGLLAGQVMRFVYPYIARTWHRFGGRRMAVRLANAVGFAPMPATHILSFIYPGDEAGRLLDALEVTTWAPTRAIRFIKEHASLVGGGMFLFVIVAAIATTIAEDFITFDAKMVEDYVTSGFAYVMVAGIYALIALMVLRYVLSILRGHPAGFGWERPSIHAHVEIGAEPVADVPVALSNAHQEVPFSAGEDARRGLRHSGLYEDKRILKALAFWIAHVR